MKKNIWVVLVLAVLVVFAGSASLAMMQQGETRCGMMKGDTTKCPMTQGDMTQCPMMQNGRCSGDAANTECPMQTTGTNPMTKQQTNTNTMTMDNTSMGQCDHAACICDHSAGSCVNTTGMMCMCCEMCATGGMCAEGCCDMNMLKAIIDVTPGNLNLLGKGKFIIVYIELEENEDGFTVDDIDKSTIYLKQVNMMMCPKGQKIYPVGPIVYGDYDEDGIDDLMVKFNRQTIINFLLANGLDSEEASIFVAGELYGGTNFCGKDTIRIGGRKLINMWKRSGIKN
ncbi:MAG: hypothetical protein MUE70_14345 [Desulfobacterales bacterium]|jgi:hypothetical protein|nr:hypothetical protein [Desulfobacterales bacterium]